MLNGLFKKIKNLLFWDTLEDLRKLKAEVADIKQANISLSQISQTILNNQLKAAFNSNSIQAAALGEIAFKANSQFEEDGILLHLFAAIGTTNKKSVEIGCSDGRESNSTNLILNHGWTGLLLEGDKGNVERGNIFFATHPNTYFNPPLFKNVWITKDNINSIISEAGFAGEVDLLSIDIDGNDYYIMEAISAIKSRVIVCEVQGMIPPDLAVTIPYKEDFYCWNKPYPEVNFRSLSPAAAVKLLGRKGYRLIGAHKEGFNLFFIKNELGLKEFPTITAADIYNRVIAPGGKKIWEDVKGYGWVNV